MRLKTMRKKEIEEETRLHICWERMGMCIDSMQQENDPCLLCLAVLGSLLTDMSASPFPPEKVCTSHGYSM